jgi:SAM-dependent methyltransferase
MRADDRADHVYDRYADEFPADDPRASGYRSVRWFRNERALILGVLRQHVASDATVLDLACGAGLVTRPLRDEDWEVVGLDYNEVACRSAVRSGLDIVRGDAFSLPFRDRSFGAVLTVEMLQQYPTEEVRRLIAECRRVLEDGGSMILVWRNGRSLVHRLATLLLRPVDRSRGLGDLGLKDHPPAAIRTLARSLGLEVVLLDAILPPLRWRFPVERRALTRLVGSSHLAILRRTDRGSDLGTQDPGHADADEWREDDQP